MKVRQLDLNADPEPEVRHLLMRVGMQRITSTRPAPDRFVYTVRIRRLASYGAGAGRLTPELRRSGTVVLNRGSNESICTDRGAQGVHEKASSIE